MCVFYAAELEDVKQQVCIFIKTAKDGKRKRNKGYTSTTN